MHVSALGLLTCTFDSHGASNTNKIPREDPQRETKRAKMWAGEGKQSANFLGSPPLEAPPPLGPHSSPTFSGFGPSHFLPHFPAWPTFQGPTMTHTRSIYGLTKIGLTKIDRAKTTMAKNGLAKIGLAKIGQIRMAKTGLAKVGPFR